MSEQVIAVINAICEKFGVAIDWTQDNVFPYLQELCQKYIRYEIATSAFLCLIFVTTTSVLLFYSLRFHKKAMSFEIIYDGDEIDSIIATVLWICFAVFAIMTLIVFSVQMVDIITCLTFPEKMIIQFANSLVKS